MKVALGKLDVVISEKSGSTATTMSLDLPAWIRARRYQFCVEKTVQGWQQVFHSYTIVPFDAPVFKYSMAGDVTGLQHLFDTGQASPFEVDPEGSTPLHVSRSIDLKVAH